MIRGAHQASLLAALSNASSYKASVYTTNKDEAANNATAHRLVQEFIEHVDEHYISQQRPHDSYGRKITYDHWLEGYKKEPHTATELDHTKPGFMGNWFKKVAKLPESLFSESERRNPLNSMVTEYLLKFRLAAQHDFVDNNIHEKDVRDIASSLIAILRKSGFPPSRIPADILEEISDNHPNIPEASFWREAHNYWAGQKGDADLPN